MKTILNLVPNSGQNPKELRATVNLIDALLAALFASLAQLSLPIVARMRSHLLVMQQQAISGHPANREQQDAINGAIELIDAFLALPQSK